MKKKLLISGANGFIGSVLIERLKEEYSIYATDISHSKINEKHITDFIEWDFNNNDSSLPFPNDISIIIHLMHVKAQEEKEQQNNFFINVKSILNMLEFGKNNKIEYLIYTSSGTVYKPSENPITESSTNCEPQQNTLSITKYCSESIANMYRQYFKICILRLFFPYGKRGDGKLISNLINKIYQKNTVDLNTEDGRPFINPIYIVDLVNIMKCFVDNPQNDVFNIGGKDIISIKDLSKIIGEILGIKPVFNYLNKNNILNLIGDISKLLIKFNYINKYSLYEGIKETIINSNIK